MAHFLKRGNVSVKAGDEYTKELHQAVVEVRTDDKRREPIMTWEMLKNDVAYAARKEGLEEGRAEGRTEGASEEKRETVFRMRHAGISDDIIMTATGLSEEERRSFEKAGFCKE